MFWLFWNRELPLSVIAGGLEGLWASPSVLLRNSGLWQLWPERTGQASFYFLVKFFVLLIQLLISTFAGALYRLETLLWHVAVEGEVPKQQVRLLTLNQPNICKVVFLGKINLLRRPNIPHNDVTEDWSKRMDICVTLQVSKNLWRWNSGGRGQKALQRGWGETAFICWAQEKIRQNFIKLYYHKF